MKGNTSVAVFGPQCNTWSDSRLRLWKTTFDVGCGFDGNQLVRQSLSREKAIIVLSLSHFPTTALRDCPGNDLIIAGDGSPGYSPSQILTEFTTLGQLELLAFSTTLSVLFWMILSFQAHFNELGLDCDSNYNRHHQWKTHLCWALDTYYFYYLLPGRNVHPLFPTKGQKTSIAMPLSTSLH